MDFENPPELYWHCYVISSGEKDPAVENDLTYSDIERKIVKPWRSGRAFTVAGKIVRSPADASDIRIAHTPQPKLAYANRHDAEMHAAQIADLVTDRRLLPFSKGEDVTMELLFEGTWGPERAPADEIALIEQVCRRLPRAAGILAHRSRTGKSPYTIDDEYDVQDLLHGVLRAYLKYSVQEDPLPKVAATKSSRVDISIEDLGVLIEIKFVRDPKDQQDIVKDLSQDLLEYVRWPHLKVLLYMIYNSAALRDPEALEKLSGSPELDGRRFDLKVILA